MDYNKPRGHRVFSVINPDVQELVVQALLDTGLREDKRFTSGPSTQVVFNDGTVVNYLDRAIHVEAHCWPPIPAGALGSASRMSRTRVIGAWPFVYAGSAAGSNRAGSPRRRACWFQAGHSWCAVCESDMIVQQ